MGGRTVDFAVPETNVSTIYAAVGPSGLWKTEDAGVTWFPVGDGQITTGSIGSIDVAPHCFGPSSATASGR